ncbi:MAG: glycosyltransferase family 2 protein [Lachnospiraceae bacterium]|nr:glycosyltransferase family 2 protein [Lachnospiraceae bacterium]
MSRKIDVIIPTYRPGEELFELLDAIKGQSIHVNRIILMNTEKSFFKSLTKEMDFEKEYPGVEVYHLSKKQFDHGATRRSGVEKSDAEVFVMLTQDAMPANDHLLEELTKDLTGDVAVAYGRQLPRRDSGSLERVSRKFNYPEKSYFKGKEDLEKLGIKTYFCSNVCAAYRRDVYEKLGGFPSRAIFNEDMIYAAKAVQAGWRIAYEADAMVIHSHNYSCMQQFHRNFDLGASQADHPEVFASVKSESEGKKLVKYTVKALKDRGQLGMVPYFFTQSGFKYAGYLMGKHYEKLPKWLILWASDNKTYWKRSWKSDTKSTQKKHRTNTN